MKYFVDVEFTYSGYLPVQASNKEEAKKIAQETCTEEFLIQNESFVKEIIDVREAK